MIKKLLLSVLAIFGFSLFLLNGNTFALDNKSVTYTSSSHSDYLCWSTNCAGYNYLLVEYSDDFTGQLNVFRTSNDNSTSITFPQFNSIYRPILFDITSGSITNFHYSSGDFTGSITFTLSESNPYSTGIVPSGTLNITENGTYDVTNYASAVVDVPQTVEGEGSFIVNLFKGGFWNVSTAIVGLIVPVLALFLVFRLIHGLIYGKGV